MNHDKATPRPWIKTSQVDIDGPNGIGVGISFWDGIQREDFKPQPPFPNLEEARANAALICEAVNAWDDPVKLRNRLDELEAKATLEIIEIAKKEADHA